MCRINAIIKEEIMKSPRSLAPFFSLVALSTLDSVLDYQSQTIY